MLLTIDKFSNKQIKKQVFWSCKKRFESDYLNILFGVPQGSIAGPLFLNVYTCDMFFQIDTSEFFSYADHNTHFASTQNQETNKNFAKHSKWCV